MQIITSTYLEKMKNAWNHATCDEDNNASKGAAYFDALKTLVDGFDVVQLNESEIISGDFSIDSEMAMLTDGATAYSLDGIDPVKNKEYVIAHVTGASYVVTIDIASCKLINEVNVTRLQLVARDNAAWLIDNADTLVERCHNLEAEWIKGSD